MQSFSKGLSSQKFPLNLKPVFEGWARTAVVNSRLCCLIVPSLKIHETDKNEINSNISVTYRKSLKFSRSENWRRFHFFVLWNSIPFWLRYNGLKTAVSIPHCLQATQGCHLYVAFYMGFLNLRMYTLQFQWSFCLLCFGKRHNFYLHSGWKEAQESTVLMCISLNLASWGKQAMSFFASKVLLKHRCAVISGKLNHGNTLHFLGKGNKEWPCAMPVASDSKKCPRIWLWGSVLFFPHRSYAFLKLFTFPYKLCILFFFFPALFRVYDLQ